MGKLAGEPWFDSTGIPISVGVGIGDLTRRAGSWRLTSVLVGQPSFFRQQIKPNKKMLTVEERNYNAKVTASLRNIERQLGRIADALEKLVGQNSNEPLNEEEE